ncbi:DUF4129 domain-containing protein [Halosegnis marinus]|uniref:DUF4129 domain-containing protein n=1 Tax=Halosegnis marinus TaxID=3034023 RepID=A0ABD5ZM35_9EURY|nr:DUF4129 domain-containing protein [Halosegnis sp. DT85]
MNRRHAAAALLAALVVVALPTAAASLDVLGNDGGDLGTGTGDGFGFGSTGGGYALGDGAGTPLLPDIGPLEALALLVLFVLLGAYGLYSYWRAMGLAGLAATFAGALLVALFLLFSFSATLGRGGETNSTLNNTTSAGGGGGSILAGETTSTPVDPSFALSAVLLACLVGAGLAFAYLGRDDLPSVGSDPAPEDTDPDVAAVGRTAGEAADRIAEGTAVENEVYRAWRTMTDHLDVASPATSTPGDFADAAVEAGMDREDVAALTDLFEETRYGDYEVTEERAERAVAALREVEAVYAAEDEE